MANKSNEFDNLQVEDRVKHPVFGEGQILQRSGEGEDTKLLVAFQEEGEKKLLARYAKLKKVRPVSTSASSAKSDDSEEE